MVSLPEELQAREAATRQRVEELQAEAAELTVRLEKAQADLSRLEITRETVAQVLAELSAAEAAPEVGARDGLEPKETPAPHGIGVMAVPPWWEGLVATPAVARPKTLRPADFAVMTTAVLLNVRHDLATPADQHPMMAPGPVRVVHRGDVPDRGVRSRGPPGARHRHRGLRA
ncbi:hypothetical protein GCM10010350_82080 [Streptomyces galilaeus]|nr:hypothetical protein GCM10010350_82080 [Streptomyces galilaeus]